MRIVRITKSLSINDPVAQWVLLWVKRYCKSLEMICEIWWGDPSWGPVDHDHDPSICSKDSSLDSALGSKMPKGSNQRFFCLTHVQYDDDSSWFVMIINHVSFGYANRLWLILINLCTLWICDCQSNVTLCNNREIVVVRPRGARDAHQLWLVTLSSQAAKPRNSSRGLSTPSCCDHFCNGIVHSVPDAGIWLRIYSKGF